MSKLLLNEQTISVNRELAIKIGLQEALYYSMLKEISVNKIIINPLDLFDYDIFSDKSKKRYLDKLIKYGLVYRVVTNANQQYDIAKRMVVKQIIDFNGKSKCKICGVMHPRLNRHHYPIKRCEGGNKVIDVCPNCHYLMHSLEVVYELADI